jgi:hypothetical protein
MRGARTSACHADTLSYHQLIDATALRHLVETQTDAEQSAPPVHVRELRGSVLAPTRV